MPCYYNETAHIRAAWREGFESRIIFWKYWWNTENINFKLLKNLKFRLGLTLDITTTGLELGQIRSRDKKKIKNQILDGVRYDR